MARQTFIQMPDGKLVPKEEYYAVSDAPYIMPDIQPYQSMATGEMVMGRRQHREHLKAHRLIEIGNEKQQTSRQLQPPPGLRERLHAVADSKLRSK